MSHSSEAWPPDRLANLIQVHALHDEDLDRVLARALASGTDHTCLRPGDPWCPACHPTVSTEPTQTTETP